jgi:hypothetical protein
MQYADIHLRLMMAVGIGIIDFFEDIQSLFHFSEDSMLSGKGGEVGFGEGDEELAIVEVRALVSGGDKSQLVEFHFHIDLIFEVGHL